MSILTIRPADALRLLFFMQTVYHRSPTVLGTSNILTVRQGKSVRYYGLIEVTIHPNERLARVRPFGERIGGVADCAYSEHY
jgi:hypothetical protein